MAFKAKEMIGRVVGGYRITDQLGEGGMAVVFRGVQETLNHVVAVKMVQPHLLRTAGIRERFIREARAMGRVTHPNIVQIYNLIDNQDGCFIVMEFVEGATFDEILERHGPVAAEQAIVMMLPVLRALEFAHRRNIIHRDIKPANLMRLTDGTCKVMDFGTAKLTDDTRLTAQNTTLGTVVYMAPEQLMGQDDLSRADVYSVGVTLYELITGVRPFEDDGSRDLMMRIMKDAPPPPSLHVRIPPTLERAILRAMSKDKGQRFETAEAFANELERIQIQLRAPSAPPAPRRVTPKVVTPQAGPPKAETPSQVRTPSNVAELLGGAPEAPRRTKDTRSPRPFGPLGGLGLAGVLSTGLGLALLVTLVALGHVVPGVVAGTVLVAAGLGLLIGALLTARRIARTAKLRVPPSRAPKGATCLEFLDGPLAGERQDLDQATLTVGRAPDNRLVLNDVAVSSRHARIDLYEGRWYVSDLDSTNGTFVNQDRVQQVEIKSGDLITFGGTNVVVRLP